MPGSREIKSRLALGAAALSLLAAGPASATPRLTRAAPAKTDSCSAVLRALSPRERRYVVGIMSMTYTQLAAAFGTREVHLSSRPIDSCERAK
jgi:hypothetical protein